MDPGSTPGISTNSIMLYDPLRKMYVAATPEEQVRQWFIQSLKDTFGVPAHRMMSEVSMKFGDKRYRSDILVYGKDARPLAVVECKRPEVSLSGEVLRQAMRYNMVLDVRFLIVTNGNSTYAYERKDGMFVPMGQMPDLNV